MKNETQYTHEELKILANEEATQIVTSSGVKFSANSIIDLSAIEEKSIDWLVYPYLIRGAITSVEGESDMAKSLVMADFAARFTANLPFPNNLIRKYEEPQGVVFVVYEDDVAEAIKPRFIKAGGNDNLLKVIRFVDDGDGLRGLDLSWKGDRELLEIAMVRVNAVAVVIDPITSALGNIDIVQYLI